MALMGRYLSEIGLSDSAIVFITSARPENLRRLTFEDAKAIGIDVRLFQTARTDATSRAAEEPRREPATPLRQRAVEFLGSYYEAVSSTNDITVRFLSAAYSENLKYFGKPMTKQEVIAQTQRFMERWPKRKYGLRPTTLTIDCLRDTCLAKGVLDYEAISEERQERSRGQASFELELAFEEARSWPKITSENGAIVDRKIEALNAPVNLLPRTGDYRPPPVVTRKDYE